MLWEVFEAISRRISELILEGVSERIGRAFCETSEQLSWGISGKTFLQNFGWY